jgi:hypothetical protein
MTIVELEVLILFYNRIRIPDLGIPTHISQEAYDTAVASLFKTGFVCECTTSVTQLRYELTGKGRAHLNRICSPSATTTQNQQDIVEALCIVHGGYDNSEYSKQIYDEATKLVSLTARRARLERKAMLLDAELHNSRKGETYVS